MLSRRFDFENQSKESRLNFKNAGVKFTYKVNLNAFGVAVRVSASINIPSIAMTIENYYLLLLSLCCTLVVAQLFVKEKKAAHLLFALVCGSIALATTKKLTQDSLNGYQYLIGMGACVTCNGFWLLARALFREKHAILKRHVVFAIAIAALVIWRQGYLFIDSQLHMNARGFVEWLNIAAYELTLLLSSSVLMLAFWEGCRGFSQSQGQEKAQRVLFLSAYFICVAGTKLIENRFADNREVQEWAVTSAAILIILTAQVLLYWRFSSQRTSTSIRCVESNEPTQTEDDIALQQQVEHFLIEQKGFLKEGLKVADLAQQFNEPEYKISRVIRQNLQARNFSQLVNELRVEHAKVLLQDPAKQHWPVLVVGLESGFASVGPFTRAFKIATGTTPNQFRKQNGQTQVLREAQE